MSALTQRLFARKEVDTDIVDEHGKTGLSRNLGLIQLTSLGVGATIGTGIFFILSEAVPEAGPAVIISFIIAGVVAGLTALCYAELAGAVPAAGSSYSYAYATLGELAAVGVGACLLLEYGVSAAAVAVGWSEYVNKLLDNVFGFQLPEFLSNAPEEGGMLNLPAVVLVLMCGFILSRGASESATLNAIMVGIKLLVLAVFIVIGVQGWTTDHFHGFWDAGASGILSAAGLIFFSYIGLDVISTAGAEAKNPRRNMPLAIVLALIIVIAVYVTVATVAIAAQPISEFEGQEAGLSEILTKATGSTWPATFIAVGAVISIFSITLVVMYGQTRILFSMAKDGMIPAAFGRVTEKKHVPFFNTVVVTLVVALLAGVLPINFLAEMTSIGTLIAFFVVSLGVMILRHRRPDLDRSFKVPLYPVVPILSMIGCLVIILELRPITLIVCAVWILISFGWYAIYGYKNSKLAKQS